MPRGVSKTNGRRTQDSQAPASSRVRSQDTSSLLGNGTKASKHSKLDKAETLVENPKLSSEIEKARQEILQGMTHIIGAGGVGAGTLSKRFDEDMSAEEHMASVLMMVMKDVKWDDHVMRTAERFVDFLREYAPEDKPDFSVTTFDGRGVNQLIMVTDVEFSSVCMHHLLPFHGKAAVGYLPNEKMIGISKIPRLIDFFARRPQTQEYLTRDIASYLKQALAAQGVAVVLKAVHTCMSCRGVRKVGSNMITSEMRGTFLTAGEARSEFLRLAGDLK
jgi:GTP cyclohydrolase IA